jgi:hypothetical protein
MPTLCPELDLLCLRPKDLMIGSMGDVTRRGNDRQGSLGIRKRNRKNMRSFASSSKPFYSRLRIYWFISVAVKETNNTCRSYVCDVFTSAMLAPGYRSAHYTLLLASVRFTWRCMHSTYEESIGATNISAILHYAWVRKENSNARGETKMSSWRASDGLPALPAFKSCSFCS